jgi:anaerobic ribonucleoside-triphosphate reductase activating protein
LGEKVKALGKTIVIFSGYTLEQLIEMGKQERYIRQLLHLSDVLIDGPFIEELKDLELLFRGSSNQRIIDLSMESVSQ